MKTHSHNQAYLYFQGAQLQRELRVDENEIKDLEDQLEKEQKAYQEIFLQLQNKVENTEVCLGDNNFAKGGN